MMDVKTLSCTVYQVVDSPQYTGLTDQKILKSTLGEAEEGLVIADCNMDLIKKAKHFLCTYRQYGRPDLLWLGVDIKEKKCVRRE